MEGYGNEKYIIIVSFSWPECNDTIIIMMVIIGVQIISVTKEKLKTIKTMVKIIMIIIVRIIMTL